MGNQVWETKLKIWEFILKKKLKKWMKKKKKKNIELFINLLIEEKFNKKMKMMK